MVLRGALVCHTSCYLAFCRVHAACFHHSIAKTCRWHRYGLTAGFGCQINQLLKH